MDLVGLFVPRFKLRREPSESLNPPSEEDLERIADLREQGSKLDLPHPVRGFLAFDVEAAASAAMDQLRRDGFTCAIRAGADGSWTVTAIRQLVPSPGAITKLREQLEAVGSAQGGTYRGWDAPIVY